MKGQRFKNILIFFLLILLSLSFLQTTGCSIKESKVSPESSQKELSKEIYGGFFEKAFLFKPSEMVEVVKGGEGSGEKMTVFLTTRESSASVIQFYRLTPIENGLKILEEFEVSEGTIIMFGKDSQEIASVAIFGKNPTRIVIDYQSNKLQK